MPEDKDRGNDDGDSSTTGPQNYYTKDFTIAYDRLICLKDGQYELTWRIHTDGEVYFRLEINGGVVNTIYAESSHPAPLMWNCHLKRGDYISFEETQGNSIRGNTDNEYTTGLMIKRV